MFGGWQEPHGFCLVTYDGFASDCTEVAMAAIYRAAARLAVPTTMEMIVDLEALEAPDFAMTVLVFIGIETMGTLQHQSFTDAILLAPNI